jgi:hypothetical protein
MHNSAAIAGAVILAIVVFLALYGFIRDWRRGKLNPRVDEDE